MEPAQNDNEANNAEPGALKEAFHLTAEALRVVLPRLGFFLKTALLIFVPLELLVYWANTWIPDTTGGAIFAEAIGMLCLIVGEALYFPVCLYAYAKTRDNQEAPSLLPTLRYALDRFPAMFVFGLMYTALTVVGFVLLLVPGIYWGVRYGFGAVIASARPASLADTFAQSRALTQGRFGRVAAVVFVPLICMAILALLLFTIFFLILHPSSSEAFSEFVIGVIFDFLMAVPFLAFVLFYERLTGEPIALSS